MNKNVTQKLQNGSRFLWKKSLRYDIVNGSVFLARAVIHETNGKLSG